LNTPTGGSGKSSSETEGDDLNVSTVSKSRLGERIAFLREQGRLILALATLFVLAWTAYLAWKRAGTPRWEDTKNWLQVVLPVETTLLGSAWTFYFTKPK
jgi:heme A synthase